MKNTFNTVLGALILLMGFYTVITLIQIIFGWTETKFSEIVIPLIIISIFFLAMVIGYYKKDVKDSSQEATLNATDKHQPTVEEVRKYNPDIDKLNYAMYEQSVKTWWSDSDGDTHHHSTNFANLRFYENGIVIGVRNKGVLKIDEENSFVYKGTWKLHENNIEISLQKVKEIEDFILIYISPEERRDMKYAGHIANDDSLIKEGHYKGIIKGNTLEFGNHLFTLVKNSQLIITASESACEELKNKFNNHFLVMNSYTNSGNWYSNGEEGPEWHTVTFESRYELKEQLEMDIKKSSIDYSNMFWG